MEIMIVIVLLGVLMTLGVGGYMSSQKKARDVRRKGDLRQLTVALETFFNDKLQYPDDNGSGGIVGCGSDTTQLCSWGESFTDGTSIYMAELPKDPKPTSNYYYIASADRKSYQLYARLENLEDKDVANNAGSPGVYTSTTCSSEFLAGCNFGIASTNSNVTSIGSDE